MPATRAMDRAALEKASLDELQKMAKRCGLPTASDRVVLLDAILSYAERKGSADPLRDTPSTSKPTASEPTDTEAGAEEEPLTPGTFREALSALTENFTRQQLEFQRQQQEMLAQNQEIMLRMLQQIAGSGHAAPNGAEAPVVPEPNGTSVQAAPAHETRSERSVDFMPTGHSINWMASQIPEFKGGEDENVHAWVRRVDRVATIHGASDGIILLAASSKLAKFAKQWYEIQTGSVIESWSSLKNELIKIFERKVPFYKSLQRAEARKWIQSKESFDQYAIAKLALIHQLDLPVRDTIHLLISGVSQSAVKATALSMANESLDSFLEKMRQVTEGMTESEKRFPVATGRTDTRSKGHRQFDCPTLKNKGTQPNTTRAAVSSTAAAVSTEETSSEVVAAVLEEEGSLLELSRPFVTVTSLCNRVCKLSALVDTGSPVSFVKHSVYEYAIKPFVPAVKPVNKKFVNLSKEPLNIMGMVSVSFTIDSMEHRVLNTDLYILGEKSVEGDIILGREFLRDQKLALLCRLYDQSASEQETHVNLFSQLPLCVQESEPENLKNKIESLDIDFDLDIKKKLVDLIIQVESAEIEKIDDDYCVTVKLKDTSVYAYAPRRLAYAERIEIRKITDDLLERGIIKPSVSPYCARVIPIRKRNGLIRLCVDLRPLNSRVEKQKYPFPLIEECLTKLNNKQYSHR
nr:PREDICTED: uncharacterized protein LOC105676627 [Linepithema humile]